MPLARLHSRVWGSYKLQRWNIRNCAQMVCQALDWLPTSRERKKHDVFDAAEQHIFESRGLKSAEQSKEDHTRKENVWSGFWSGRWKLSQVIFTWRERLGACWNVCAIQWWNQRWGCRQIGGLPPWITPWRSACNCAKVQMRWNIVCPLETHPSLVFTKRSREHCWLGPWFSIRPRHRTVSNAMRLLRCWPLLFVSVHAHRLIGE